MLHVRKPTLLPRKGCHGGHEICIRLTSFVRLIIGNARNMPYTERSRRMGLRTCITDGVCPYPVLLVSFCSQPGIGGSITRPFKFVDLS